MVVLSTWVKSLLKGRLILLLGVAMFIGGCSSLPEKYVWEDSTTYEGKTYLLEEGDIILKKKAKHPLSWGGHMAIVTYGGYVGEYPRIGVGYIETPVEDWFDEEKGVIILRYDKMTSEFKLDLRKHLHKSNRGSYLLFTKKDNDKNKFYCSQFVWKLYHEAGKDQGIDIDLDSNGGFFMFPYDMLHTEGFTQIRVGEKLK